MAQDRLLRKVQIALDRFPPVRDLGVAVSGGPDSVALCGALIELAPKRGLRLTALHVNHALRPEAAHEQKLVESLCQQWQIPCLVETLTPPQTRKGIEAWARERRYNFFQTARGQYHLSAVAVAHTLDDQAETVLFRLLRGTARRGLAGIPPVRDGWIIRPLLHCSRQEVLAFLHARQLPYAIDSSNADQQYARNKIRHILLPFLEHEFSPQIRFHLATLADALRPEEDWLEILATAARARVQEEPRIIALDRLQVEPPALQRRILRQWLEHNGQGRNLGFQQLDDLHALSVSGSRGKVELPGKMVVRCAGNRLLLEPQRPKPVSYCHSLSPRQEICLPEVGWRIAMTAPEPWSGELQKARIANPWQAIFDTQALPDTLEVRNFRPGDRIHPLGLSGSKKVHDVFIDGKVPLERRRLLPLIVIGPEVAWVPGCVRGETAKVTVETRWVCRIIVNPLPGK
jgi:tRNA(Ile)-lysidine synthase